MKKSGFTYIPHVPNDMLNPPAPKPSDYVSLKAFRSKYGFGDRFAPYVYPGDPNITEPTDVNPNDTISGRLDPGQLKAYRVALDGNWNDKSGPLKLIGGCMAEAAKVVDPDNWTRAKLSYEMHKPGFDENSQEFKQSCATNPACSNYNADEARLKPLRDAYGACLKGKGYAVEDENVEEVAKDSLVGELDRLDQDPDLFNTKIDPAAAREALKKEIRVALEDLECGKDYLATQAQIDAKNHELSPPSGRLL
jgi:hypothetical protein